MMPPAKTESASYLDKPGEVDRFLDEISDVRELALDTEGASFHRFLDRIYLLQISTRGRSAIIDPLPIGSPAKLGAVLQEWSTAALTEFDAETRFRLLAAKGDPKKALRVLDKLDVAFGKRRN